MRTAAVCGDCKSKKRWTSIWPTKSSPPGTFASSWHRKIWEPCSTGEAEVGAPNRYGAQVDQLHNRDHSLKYLNTPQRQHTSHDNSMRTGQVTLESVAVCIMAVYTTTYRESKVRQNLAIILAAMRGTYPVPTVLARTVCLGPQDSSVQPSGARAQHLLLCQSPLKTQKSSKSCLRYSILVFMVIRWLVCRVHYSLCMILGLGA